MSTFTAPRCFIAKNRTHKVLTIILHTSQVTQTINLSKAKPKQMFYISCDQLTPSMAIVHALHLGRVVSNQKDGQQFKQDVPIKSNYQKLDFSQRDLVIIQSLQFVQGLS
jgi:hypothetical protein